MVEKSIDQIVELMGVEVKTEDIKNPHLKRVLNRISYQQQFKHRYNDHSRYSETPDYNDYSDIKRKYSEYSDLGQDWQEYVESSYPCSFKGTFDKHGNRPNSRFI